MMKDSFLMQIEVLPVLERTASLTRHPVVTLLLLLVFVFICILLSMQTRYFQDMLKVMFSTKSQNAFLHADAAMPNVFLNMAAYVVAIVNISAFGIFFAKHFDAISFNLLRCMMVLTAVVIWLIFKWLVFKVFSATLAKDKSVDTFSDDYFKLVTFFGMFLYPLVVLAVYAPPTWQFGCFVVMCVVAFLWAVCIFIKLIQYFFTRIGNLLYIFLYLCALEIMPILLLRKLVFSLFEFV